MGRDVMTGRVWVLRAACGCPWAATIVAKTPDEAWEFAAGTRSQAVVARMVAEGWRLELEPSDTAVPDLRARLGSCPHVSKQHAAEVSRG